MGIAEIFIWVLWLRVGEARQQTGIGVHRYYIAIFRSEESCMKEARDIAATVIWQPEIAVECARELLR